MVSFYFILILCSRENRTGGFPIVQAKNKSPIILHITDEVRLPHLQVLNVAGLGIHPIALALKLRLKRATKLPRFQVKQEKMGGAPNGELLHSAVVIDVCDLIMKISRAVYGQGLFQKALTIAAIKNDQLAVAVA